MLEVIIRNKTTLRDDTISIVDLCKVGLTNPDVIALYTDDGGIRYIKTAEYEIISIGLKEE